MTQMIVLPHVELCPEGAVIEAKPIQEPAKTETPAKIEAQPPS